MIRRAYVENSVDINAIFCISLELWGSFFVLAILPNPATFTWWLFPMVITSVSAFTGFVVAIYFLLEHVAHRMAEKP